MENKNMEVVNETMVKKGNGKVGLLIGALGALAGLGTVLFIKHKKNKVEVEPEVETVDNNE